MQQRPDEIEFLKHSCAKQAASDGAPELAETWAKSNCQHGYRLSCEALVRVRPRLAR